MVALRGDSIALLTRQRKALRLRHHETSTYHLPLWVRPAGEAREARATSEVRHASVSLAGVGSGAPSGESGEGRVSEHPYTLVGRARAAGTLRRNPCEVCGAPKAEAHHDDYAQPLAVRWLCRTCHRQWHVQHGPGLNHHLIERPERNIRRPDALMTPDDVVEYLAKEKGLPILRAGTLPRFRKAELDAWLERERVA